MPRSQRLRPLRPAAREIGDVAKGFKEADAVHEMTYSTSRVQHVHLETHGSIAWKGEVELINGHFDFIGERLPQTMRDELTALEGRLNG